LCQLWEEQPPDFESFPVFFTVGHIAVRSALSGVPQVGSLCRQFLTWLGQTGEYDPSQIAFTMVDGQGIYMSVPNLTQFQVRLKDGPNGKLESVITLEPKTKGKAQVLKARALMTVDYPPTAFKACHWWGCPDGTGPNGEDVLVDIMANLRWPGGEENVVYPQLFISEFYSKSSDPKTAPSIEPNSKEDLFLRGSGRRLLCQMLDSIRWTHPVNLYASGMSYHDQVYFTEEAKRMQVDDIAKDLEETVMKDEPQVMKALKTLNPFIFQDWEPNQSDEGLALSLEDADLGFLRDEWVRARANLKLVSYYMRTFGFQPVSRPRFTFVKMEAIPEMIRRHCHANAVKDSNATAW
jgi:hypothetical protein